MLNKPKPLLLLLVALTAVCLTGCGDESPATLASSASFHDGSAGGYDTDDGAPAAVVVAGQPIEGVFDAGIVLLRFALPVASRVTVTASPLDIAWQSGESPATGGAEVITGVGSVVILEFDAMAGNWDIPVNADYLPSGCYRIVIEASSSDVTLLDISNVLLVHSYDEVPLYLRGLYSYSICRYSGDC